MDKNIDNVQLGHVKRMVDMLDKHFKGDDTTEISFEFLISSCFPTCFKNIEDKLKEQYTLGFIAGKAEGEKDA